MSLRPMIVSTGALFTAIFLLAPSALAGTCTLKLQTKDRIRYVLDEVAADKKECRVKCIEFQTSYQEGWIRLDCIHWKFKE